ncbi:MAG: hypothetical protein ACP6IP_10805 [Candidatus Njordarchaeia archaeon]
MTERNITDFSKKAKDEYQKRFEEKQKSIARQVALKCAADIVVELLHTHQLIHTDVDTIVGYMKDIAERLEEWLGHDDTERSSNIGTKEKNQISN